jgi:hypothetical protein
MSFDLFHEIIPHPKVSFADMWMWVAMLHKMRWSAGKKYLNNYMKDKPYHWQVRAGSLFAWKVLHNEYSGPAL